MTISQVALSNTFNEFRQTVNNITNTVNESIIGGTGNISANNIVGTNLVGGTIRGTTLTSGRIPVVGDSGFINDDDGLTYVVASNTLSTGALVLASSATVGTTLGVTGAATLSNTLAVTGATTLSSTLGVTGATTLSNNVTFGSGANVATYFSSNGYFEVSKGIKATVDLHADQHIGAGGELTAWVAAKNDNQTTHKVFAIANTNAAQDMLVVNQSDGNAAYAEFIAIHHSGNTDQGWISMGVNSTNYADGAYGVTKADDGYMLYSAPTGTTKSGDLIIGTSGNGTGNKIILSADGFDDPANNAQLVIHPGQKVVVNIPTQSSNTTTGALVVNGGIGLQGNLNIGGNVAITGTITLGGGGNTVSTSSLQVDNPIIFVGSNNAADTFDLGINGEYTSTGTKYTGLVRDASDSGKWKLYSGITNKPANTVNFTGATYDTLYLGAIQAVGSTASTSNTTGTIIVTGGVGVAGKVFADTLETTTTIVSGTSITAGTTVSDSKGDVRRVPQNSQSTSYVLVAADAGKHISTTAGVTVNTSVFSVGDVVTIYNNSGSNITVTQGTSVTLRLAGTSTTGNRTLAQRGMCNLLCVAAGEFIASGSGVS